MIHRGFGLEVAVFVIALLLSACTPALSVTKSTPALAERLTIRGWEGYMPQSILDAFTAEYGVPIEYIPYGEAQEAIDEMRQGAVFDVVVLDNVAIQEVAKENLLAELDHRNLPNFKHIATNFRDLAFDPKNKYSVPFQWGTSGLLYRTTMDEAPPTAWADLWNPAFANKIGVWPYHRDLIGMALKSLGYSYNSENPRELPEAGAHLMELRDRVFMLDPFLASGVPHLLNGDALVIVGWAYDMQVAEAEAAQIAYILPEEGSIIWMDNLVIPANSSHKHTAELFLNFILRPKIGARLANEMYVAVPNEGAYQYIEPEILGNPLIFPTAEELEKAEFYSAVGPETQALHQEIWTRFLSNSR